MTHFPNLFSEGRIGNLVIPNRIVMPPMATNLANEDGSVSQRLIDYYAARARGGVGLIIVENVQVDYPQGKNVACQLRLDNDKYMAGFFELAEAVHSYGTKIFMQIHHAGAQTTPGITEGLQPVSPSGVPCSFLGIQPRELSIDEIEEIIQKFVNTAVRVKGAMFDGIELHGAHGYLIGQFMSPRTNRRVDKYGGNLEGRMRFPLEIIRRIKEAVGDDYPICFRFSADEFIEGGITLEEGKQIAKMLEEAGVHVLHVSAGVYDSMPTLLEPSRFEQGWRVYLAEEIKKVVSIPVITVGVIREPEFAEKIIAEGRADFVAIGRGLIADPEWPKKAREGRSSEIRKCISCNIGCIGGRVFPNLRLRCTVNPVAGREGVYGEIKQSPVKKKVVVVGGGPAGMQAANTAAKRGHQVILYEKKQNLGGQLEIASAAPGKAKIKWFRDWLEAELLRAGVEIRSGVTADAETIASLSPDYVILAAGSKPVTPKIKGLEKENNFVVQAWDVLAGKVSVEKNEEVVVVGGGLVGCEAAHYLAEKGAKVIVVEMLSDIAMDMEPISRFDMLQQFAKLGITIRTSNIVSEITPEGVVIVGKGGKMGFIRSKKVVLAVGQTPVGNELKKALEEKGIPVRVIGDAYNVGKIIDAVSTGFQVACQV
ncbi:oxidoreductase [Carboxydothermus pertinax]|uniref:NADH oxidase n=1 Tax=Carboxydothermus pertinax TaxID=870242 RepID=A0A1L8CS40_9THEO|nr:FAD-dependent oxidoreductase [Carboxydothermus pertinax]GAV21629.1 NADH oxidase [Carboxydothermus pertinax]